MRVENLTTKAYYQQDKVKITDVHSFTQRSDK